MTGNEKIAAFLKDINEVCERHGLQIEAEDGAEHISIKEPGRVIDVGPSKWTKWELGMLSQAEKEQLATQFPYAKSKLAEELSSLGGE